MSFAILRRSGRDNSRWLQTHHPLLDGEDQRLEARLNPQLAQQVDHVGANRLVADVQLLGDLLVAQTLSKCRQDLALTRREAGEGGSRRLLLGPLLGGYLQ